MHMNKLIAVVAPVALLAGCQFYDVDRLNASSDTGTSYSNYLARDYKGLANFEGYQMYDWTDAEHFAQKGLAASSGQEVQPDEVSTRTIDSTIAQQELGIGRERLMAALQKGAAQKAPEASARAVVTYDCWAEQMEEGWQYSDVASCKRGFIQALQIAENSVAPEPAVERQQPQTAPEPRVQEVPKQYLVFFDWDRATLQPAAREIIRTAADNARKANLSVIHVTGHADRSGPSPYNQGLSERRARAVADELVKYGFDRADILITARGEADPLVSTGDGVREPQNRRVEIVIGGQERPNI